MCPQIQIRIFYCLHYYRMLHTLQYQKRTTCTNSVNHEGEMCAVIKKA